MRWIWLPILLGVFACRAGAADSEEIRVREVIKRLPTADQEFLANAKYAGHFKKSRLVEYSNQDGRLLAAFRLPDELVKQFNGAEPLLISLEGTPHAWSIHRRKAGTLDEGFSLITLTCYAPDVTWPFNRCAVTCDAAGGLMVSGAQMFGHPLFLPYISLNQGERSVHMVWRIEAEKYVVKKMELIEAGQIANRAPNLFDKYLLPVMRQLGPATPAGDVYRVFDQIPADREVTKKVLPLVAKLDAAEASTRDAALAELRRMGRPAILATLRIEFSALSPEQSSRLSAFRASEGWFHAPDIEAARKDETFLTACLEDEDPAVRSAAEATLAAIRAARGIGR